MNLADALLVGKFNLWNRDQDRLRVEHPLQYLFWESTLNCNFFCKHCGSSAGRHQVTGELTTKEIMAVFRSISQKIDPKTVTIAVTGGEPLLRSDLFEVMSYASSLGFPWGMVTNGFLVTPHVVKQMKQSGMKTIVVSIDDIGKHHDRYRNMPGAYDHAVRAVKLLTKENTFEHVQITTTIHRGNIERLHDMYTTFSSLSITSWRVMNVSPIGRAESQKDFILQGKQLRELLDFIKAKRKEAPFEILYGCEGFLGSQYEGKVRDHLFSCKTGITIGSILANGDIFVCPNVPRIPSLIQGNVRLNDFMDVWENRFFYSEIRTELHVRHVKRVNFGMNVGEDRFTFGIL